MKPREKFLAIYEKALDVKYVERPFLVNRTARKDKEDTITIPEKEWQELGKLIGGEHG